MIFLDTLNIVIGETGSGKSMFEMLVMEHFIMQNDPRPIVTTLSIQLPEFADYLQNKYGTDAPGNLASRIVRIYKEDLAKFWRVRGIQYNGDYEYGPKKVGVFGGPDWQVAMPGVIYLLDEAYVCFKAREFQKNSGEFLDYQPQARKLDVIIAVAPASSLLDKAFRDLANQCIVLTNMYKVKVKGFTAQRKLLARVYKNCPPIRGEEVLEELSLTIDPKGLAKCYRSEEGIGVIGTTADKGRVAKGIPWWFIFPGAVCIGILAWFVLTRILHGGMRWGFHKLSISDQQNAAAARAAFNKVAPAPVSPFSGLAAPLQVFKPEVHTNPPPHRAQARGFAVLNGVIYIDTRLGQVVAKSWTNTGDTILANGIEWTFPDAQASQPRPGFLK